MTNKHNKILITGGAGYIGSVLVRLLLQKKYTVGVVDILNFGGESLLEVYNHSNFTFYREDIRNTKKLKKIVNKYDIVVHLAAIVGDPACKQQPELSKETNVIAAKNLYKLAEKSKCKKFIFASTCSNYGKMKNSSTYINEQGELSPLSLYAQTKVEFEQFLLNQKKTNVCKPTCLRFATVYGIGPRIRFDLTINQFTKELALKKELIIYGEQFWRPYCHVTDLARAIILTIEAPNNITNFNVFNVGSTTENYTKKMIIKEIKKEIPKAKIKYVPQIDDPRDYKVNFDKIKQQLNFKISKNIKDGIKEINKLIQYKILNNPNDEKYKNS